MEERFLMKYISNILDNGDNNYKSVSDNGPTLDGTSFPNTSFSMHISHIPIDPNRKIKVFISSKCGIKKYDRIRAGLKEAIEKTVPATVYLFETEGASTLPAGEHYINYLIDSDVCIFLIDNADGIGEGVQKEIETSKKYNIKSLFYFCDETKKKKTAVEESLMGESFAKSKVVHSFQELSHCGAKDLIADIIAVYHFYCKDRLGFISENLDQIQKKEYVGIETSRQPTIPKYAIKNIDKCKKYIMEFSFGYSSNELFEKKEKTSVLDEWGLLFLPVLFEGKSIKLFNTAMFLEELERIQTRDCFRVVMIRWKAIQEFFLGHIEECIGNLSNALKLARDTNQPEWVINDILVDLRNQNLNDTYSNFKPLDFSAQQELSESKEELYYPVLDRIVDYLNKKCIDGLYEKRIESPFSVSFSNELDDLGEMLASTLIISMYNGSLTHILLIYERIRDCVFYLSSKYSNWIFKLNLYKLAVFAAKEKEIEGIQNIYPEILQYMTESDASSIINFCFNQPLLYQRFNSQLLAFGSIGLFLDDETYKHCEKQIIEGIYVWLESKKPTRSIGFSIFKSLSGSSYRMSQDVLSDICCRFIEKKFFIWNREMFKFIYKHIDLNEMSLNKAHNLIEHIISLFNDDLSAIKDAPDFLYALRKQNRVLTEELDSRIRAYLPKFYEGIYKLETTENKKQDMPLIIREYVECIKKNNKQQGKNGMYFGHSISEIATIRSILINNDIILDDNLFDELITTITDTVTISKESISIKLDAISLLVFIIFKFPEAYKRNHEIYERLYNKKDEIDSANYDLFSSNIDGISLKICLLFLFVSMDKNVYGEILEYLSLAKEDCATTLTITGFLVDYLYSAENVRLPANIEAAILQHNLRWLQYEYLNVRWNATLILIALSRNPENSGIVNRQIVNLINRDCFYIKNLIMRNLYRTKGLADSTKEHVISKCEKDANYAVRKVCSEILEQQ